jgi:tRNA threonylcarbamoyladenosine biosynthesis protein TsaB
LHILALDTTTREGSIAVACDATVIVEQSGNPTLTHGQRLPGDIIAALDAAGLQVEDLDLLAVAAGPGSFTGLRVGISTAQGLAVARGITVVPVPTLEALARTVDTRSPNERVAAWMDGQRGEIFGVLYDEAGHELVAPIAGTPEHVFDHWHGALDRPIVFVGDGAVRYRPIIEMHLGTSARVVHPPPLAATIARLAFEQPHRAVAPHEIVPIYVRRPDAELARERQHAAERQGGAAAVKNREIG